MDDYLPDPAARVYSPSELNREVKLHLEAGFPRLVCEGEISNLSQPRSGHCYFSLKDETAQVRCALFRSAAQRSGLTLRNGMMVLARGRVSLYEARGDYQMIVDGVREAGEGALQRAFEALKKKLGDEGLFDPSRKRSLPAYPGRIGIVTSPSGAALRDLMHVLQRRWPVAEVRLYGAAVQGAEAVGELKAALARANREAWADVLIIGRGGGSLEDLQAFNDESLARAVAASGLPVVCAVGHQTDFSICDFVADLRAPTPSAAAELATPDGAQVRAALQRFERMLGQRLAAALQQRMQHLDHLAHRLAQRDPVRLMRQQGERVAALRAALQRLSNRRVADLGTRVRDAARRLDRQHPRRLLQARRERVGALGSAVVRLGRQATARNRTLLAQLARTLDAVSPLATLDRGYAVVSDAATGRVLSSVAGVRAGDRVEARLADGQLHCAVDRVTAFGPDSGPGSGPDGDLQPAPEDARR